MFGSKKSGIPEILRSQNGDTVVSHPGVTMVRPKGKRERSPGPNLGEREKGKGPNPKWSPDLTGQCYRAAHARTRRNDFQVGGPGGLTPQPPNWDAEMPRALSTNLPGLWSKACWRMGMIDP